MNGRVAQRRIHRRHRWRSANGAPGRGADGLRRGVRALAGRDVAGGAAAVVGRDCLARARRRRATGAAAVVVDGLNLIAVWLVTDVLTPGARATFEIFEDPAEVCAESRHEGVPAMPRSPSRREDCARVRAEAQALDVGGPER